MIKNIILVASVLIALGQKAAAETAVLIGYGASSCAEFAKNYQESPGEAESLYTGWAQGFMSGLNAGATAIKGSTRDLNAKSVKWQESFLRNYCDEHPLSNYYNAVMKLYTTLPRAEADK